MGKFGTSPPIIIENGKLYIIWNAENCDKMWICQQEMLLMLFCAG